VPVLDEYVDFLAGRCRPNTVLAVAYDLKVFFTVVGKPPRRVRPVDVLAFVTAQRAGGQGRLQVAGDGGGGVSARTLRRRLSSVSGLYGFLLARGDVSVNPVPRGLPTRRERQRPGQGVPLVRVPRTLPQVLEPGEVDALTAALRTHRDRAMVAAMVLGGLRRCEVLGLRLGDLRFAGRRVFITAGKGGHQRLVPVSPRFFTEVSAYLQAERPADSGTDKVFVVLKGPRRGLPLSADGLDEILDGARGRAGLPHATCHQLRHTCLTQLQGRGVASDATFREKREHPGPGLQLPRPSQRAGRVREQCGDDLRCQHLVPSTQTMLQLLPLHPVIRMMQQMQQKARRRGGMPLPPARQAEVFGRVGKPLPTSFNRGMSLEAIAALLGHRSLDMTLRYAKIASRTVADEYFAVSEKVDALYGQPAQLPADAIGPKMARLRREHHRMLGNGWCTRPPELDCAFESICETCTFFQTSIEFRPVLAAQHDDAAAKQQSGRQQLFRQLLSRVDHNQASRPA